MHLVVRAPLPLDRLEEMVAPRFVRVPQQPDLEALMRAEDEAESESKSSGSAGPDEGGSDPPPLAPYTWSKGVMRAGPIWGLESLPVINVIRPVSDRHWMLLEFCVPTTLGCWRAVADQHVSHCLGHEGMGSVLRELQRRGWATSLSSGTGGEEMSPYSVFEVSVGLSRSGAVAWAGVIECVFAYLQMMRI